MDTIVKRVRAVARDTGLGEGMFEESVGMSIGYLNITQKRSGDPGASKIKNIVDVYPEYSLEWLMTGKGRMKLVGLDYVAEAQGTYSKVSGGVEQEIKALIHSEIEAKLHPLKIDLYESIDLLMKRDLSHLKTLEDKLKKKG